MRKAFVVAAWFSSLAVAHAAGALARDTHSVTLSVPKMYCVACELTVKKALKKVPGVEEVAVDLDKKVAVVRFDPGKARPDDLVRATANAGFAASVAR